MIAPQESGNFESIPANDPFGGPWNGQHGRKELFQEIWETLPLQVIVETGTYTGSTTQFFVEHTRANVHSVELNPEAARGAAARFAGRPRVKLACGDSRSFLQTLANDSAFPHERAFFYLDSHWNADLPLADEVALILRHWRESVIMIDDFRVPDDADYQFDSYGDQHLSLEYLGRQIESVPVFFPALPGNQETSHRRGCVVIGTDSQAGNLLGQVTRLRQYGKLAAYTATGTSGLPVTTQVFASIPVVESAVVVGAHAGHEIPELLTKVRGQIAVFEPLPDMYAELVRKFGHIPRVNLHQKAVSNFCGRARFHVANNGQSSSLFPFAKHTHHFPDVALVGEIEVEVTTLAQEKLAPELLSIDVQGSELPVLEGADGTLESVRFIQAEYVLDELYEGQIQRDDFNKWLAGRGFQPVSDFQHHSVFGDMLYENSRIPAAPKLPPFQAPATPSPQNVAPKKYVLMKAHVGFGDRLQSLSHAIQYAQKYGRTLCVDWSDSIWSDGTVDFNTFFEICGIPTIAPADLYQLPISKVVPAGWANQIDRRADSKFIFKDHYVHLLPDEDEAADLIVCASTGYRIFYLENLCWLRVKREYRDIIVSALRQFSEYPTVVHLRGTDRQAPEKHIEYLQKLETRLEGVDCDARLLVVSDCLPLFERFKQRFPNAVLRTPNLELFNANQGTHFQSAVSKQDFNLQTLIDFFLLMYAPTCIADGESIFSNMARFLRDGEYTNILGLDGV